MAVMLDQGFVASTEEKSPPSGTGALYKRNQEPVLINVVHMII